MYFQVGAAYTKSLYNFLTILHPYAKYRDGAQQITFSIPFLFTFLLQ